jgi:hypothetical protein
MKKLVLALGLTCFILFGALSLQNIYGVTTAVEMVKLDKDPKKVDDKKSADNKEAKTTTTTDAKSCESKGDAKSGCCHSTSSCCKPGESSSKGDCSKSDPDKK